MVLYRLFKERATWYQFYEEIPCIPNYKCVGDIFKALEERDLSVRFMEFQVKRHLHRWEEQGLIDSRSEGVVAGYNAFAQNEYARISHKRPIEFEEKEAGLGLIVRPA